MEWLAGIRAAIDYMEENLLTIRHSDEVARAVYFSPFYLQRGFQVMTGYSVSEYIRNRRLYLAALEVRAGRERIIDIALKYGYETPESFSRAFSRFHGSTPAQVRSGDGRIELFLPLKISVEIKGGSSMDYTVEKMPAFRLIGFARRMDSESSYREIPAYWDEIAQQYMVPLMNGRKPQTPQEQAAWRCRVGMYGLCIDHEGEGSFMYLIAGEYDGGEVPEGMSVYELPAMEWAKFGCTGPLPGALQAVNTQIFREWLPGNAEYEMAYGANIEWYASGDAAAADYRSEIWVPVRRRG